MKPNRMVLLLVLLTLGIGASAAYADTIVLADWVININGTAYPNQGITPPSNLPASVNGSSFDWALSPNANTLGTLVITLPAAAGSQFVAVYFDYDVSWDIFGSFDDYGTANGALPAGVSYEIGDLFVASIYDDVALSTTGTLLNTNATVVGGFPQDVALALSFANLSANGGVLTLNVGNTAPASGFYLQQTNNDTGTSLYLGGTFVANQGPGPIPEPGSLILLGVGIAGLLAATRLRRK